ncbi:MAG TPA: 6-phosphogluconolactonase [Verrucomicrobiae bacterium]
MKISVHQSAEEANRAAAELLAGWLSSAKNFMPAAGNTPLELYRLIAEKRLAMGHLNVFILDEYVGVPKNEPRNCANLLRRSVQAAWGIPARQFHTISSEAHDALESVLAHERKIEVAGGLDVLVLGLGQNGHLGFNEPGSAEDSGARVLDLEKISVEANRKWFDGKYAPNKGVTIGLKTILAAKRILIMAYGPHKTEAVYAMVKGPRGAHCPASFLQRLPEVHVFLDQSAAAKLSHKQ